MRSCPLWKECASTDADSVDSCLVLRTRKRARQPAAAFQHRTILRLHRIKTTFSSSFEHVQLRLRPPWSPADLSRRERRPRLPAAFQHRVRDRRVHAYQDTGPEERSVPLPAILQRQRASYQILSTVAGPSHLNSLPPQDNKRWNDETQCPPLVDPRSRDMNTMQRSARLTRRMQVQSPTLVPFREGEFFERVVCANNSEGRDLREGRIGNVWYGSCWPLACHTTCPCCRESCR